MLLKTAYRLLAPYWKSKDRYKGLGLVAFTLSLAAFEAWINMKFSLLQIDFMNALQKLQSEKFWGIVAATFGIMAIALTSNTCREFAESWLKLRWRRGLVEHFIGRWLAHKSFYRLERNHEADNPDQRISEDIRQFVQYSIQLTIGLASMLMAAGSLCFVVWTKGGSLDMTIFGRPWHIAGYMFWLAIIWAALTTVVTHYSGRKLIGINVETEEKEADFRYSLIQVRDHAEQIALYSGESVEHASLKRRFVAVWNIYKRNFFATANMSVFYGLMSRTTMFIPMIVMAPNLLSGKMDLGTLMGVSAVWVQVTTSFGWIAVTYTTIAQWRAVVTRLNVLDLAISSTRREGQISLTKGEDGNALTVLGVVLNTPSGELISTVGYVDFNEGERWLITGKTGAGKSTLIRAIAGIWPYGEGVIAYPKGRTTLFLPQKSYIPIGSLKTAICYPQSEGAFSDQVCQEILIACRLTHFAARLHDEGNWSKTMSLGEQQRLAFARALLAKPDILFLDEATSSVDAETEACLYKTLIDRFPDSTVISVAHRMELKAHHQYQLEITGQNTPAVKHELHKKLQQATH